MADIMSMMPAASPRRPRRRRSEKRAKKKAAPKKKAAKKGAPKRKAAEEGDEEEGRQEDDEAQGEEGREAKAKKATKKRKAAEEEEGCEEGAKKKKAAPKRKAAKKAPRRRRQEKGAKKSKPSEAKRPPADVWRTQNRRRVSVACFVLGRAPREGRAIAPCPPRRAVCRARALPASACGSVRATGAGAAWPSPWQRPAAWLRREHCACRTRASHFASVRRGVARDAQPLARRRPCLRKPFQRLDVLRADVVAGGDPRPACRRAAPDGRTYAPAAPS